MIANLQLSAQHEGIRRYFDEYILGVYPLKSDMYFNDTSLQNFHRFSAGNTDLSFNPIHIGGPKISMIYSERKRHKDFVFFDNYMYDISTHESVNYFDARTPFTIVKFFGGAKDMDNISFMHTQNINQSLNFGAEFISRNSTGHYTKQNTKNTSLSLFSSYTKHRYQAYFDFIYNKVNHFNNGGVQTDSLFEKTELRPENIAVALYNSSTTLSQVGLQYRHSYSFGPAQYDTIIDNADTVYTKSFNGRASIEQMISFDRYFRIYNDVPSSYYGNMYVDSLQTYDSIGLLKLNHELMFKYRLSKENDLDKSYLAASLISDIGFYNQYNADNLFINNGVKLYYQQYIGKQVISGDATTYFMGRKAGDILARLGTVIGAEPGSKHSFGANINYSLQKPDFWEEHYYSNHFIWDNDFGKTSNIELNAEYCYVPWNISLKFDAYLLKDYITYNASSLPEQINNSNQILSVQLNKKFNWNPIFWSNSVYYQYVSHSDKLSVPEFSGNSNLYFEHFLFNKALLLQLGVDVWYHSPVNGPAYMPATGVFFLQSQRQTGNYFLMDVYASIKVKRFRGFVRMGHFNDAFMPRNYFNMLHYPDRPMAFNFGISWEFYD